MNTMRVVLSALMLMMIITVAEARSTPPPQARARTMNINVATVPQIRRLPGIGQPLAEAIVAWREENGPFIDKEDLLKVEGLNEEIIEKFIERIRFQDDDAQTSGHGAGYGARPDEAPAEPRGTGRQTGGGAAARVPDDIIVNINTADAEALQQLRGIGPALAGRIVEYRNENGPFKSLEDIKNVRGIGDATFERIKANLTL